MLICCWFYQNILRTTRRASGATVHIFFPYWPTLMANFKLFKLDLTIKSLFVSYYITFKYFSVYIRITSITETGNLNVFWCCILFARFFIGFKKCHLGLSSKHSCNQHKLSSFIPTLLPVKYYIFCRGLIHCNVPYQMFFIKHVQ